MPRRSVWKGSFVDAFLMKIKDSKEKLENRKIWSRRSTILPEFVGCMFRIYNGKEFVRCKITEDKVGHKFGEFAMTRKRNPHNIQGGSKNNAQGGGWKNTTQGGPKSKR